MIDKQTYYYYKIIDNLLDYVDSAYISTRELEDSKSFLKEKIDEYEFENATVLWCIKHDLNILIKENQKKRKIERKKERKNKYGRKKN